MSITAALNHLPSILPATVIAAIIIFVTKEVFEFFRRRNERARKLSAIKLLLAEEIEKNHWSHTSMFRVLGTIKELSEDFPEAEYRLHIARNGTEHVRVKREPEDTFESNQWIPKFHDEQYKKLLPTLAELDKELFTLINSTYSELAELTHYRDLLLGFIAGEDAPPGPDLTRSFLIDFGDEKTDYFAHLNAAYLALAGKKLEGWRLR
ncbi:hypothetical protein H0E84_19955 [Luteimonas sp. SJ-92]|uniref:DUF4760 domain-containing protein n=1 Tax=Luteimonas salinisoli TaxID=2752307 RepID=A0A853JIU3_9GAMM|nr:hypothetical protein [Luteimonas salinisoli]NZA28654.1 hypothetical protein [Luteimonas salinisoli]